MKYLLIVLFISIVGFIFGDRQSQVLDFCKDNIGSEDWSFYEERTSIDGKITLGKNKFKCNLFVYEALVSGGVDVPIFYYGGEPSAPNTNDWYNENVDGFELVGKGLDALDNAWPGDIIVLYKPKLWDWVPFTGEHHMGIISGPQKTISASGIDHVIVENDWGWRTDHWTEVKVFRYHP